MKRKAYIVPAIELDASILEQLICASITGVAGVEDIEIGKGDPGIDLVNGADSRRNDVWYDDFDE
jgi:hypothetical protein